MEYIYLGSYEICRVARSHEQPVLRTQLLGKAEVSDPQTLWLAGRVGIEEVGWLEIPVDHPLLVEEVNSGRL